MKARLQMAQGTVEDALKGQGNFGALMGKIVQTAYRRRCNTPKYTETTPSGDAWFFSVHRKQNFGVRSITS